MRCLLLALCVGLAASRAAPNNVLSAVTGSQSGSTTGGASLVNTVRGAAAAGSQGLLHLPGHTQLDTRASNAAATLQGASAGHGAFTQQGAVVTGTQSRLGGVTAFGAASNQGAARNGALGSAVAGSANGAQQVAQAGVLVGAGGRPVGHVASGLGVSAAANVGVQGAVQGTGRFDGNNAVTASSQHVGPVLLPGQAAANGNVFVGVGRPALGGGVGVGVGGQGGGMPAMNTPAMNMPGMNMRGMNNNGRGMRRNMNNMGGRRGGRRPHAD